ncbi:MAG: alpha/beta fold hydrolase [Xanthomonadales bacterium]|nr:alpha/beta fold hydrolase [Xanthomonadales bacterium]
MRIIGMILLGLLAQLSAAEPRTEEVRFASGEIELAGTLVRPEGEGPFPGVVFVHGSGPHTRAGPVSYASTFTDAGVGMLAFDKRGSGESEGNWITSSLDDLVGDVCAAVDYLRAQPGFDANRIGLWGVSQGGWIAPVAALRCGPMAFMIVVSGGAVSPLQSELYSYQRAFERGGIDAEQQAEAFSVLGDYFWYLGTGKDREKLIRRLEQVRERPWYRYANLDRIMPSSEAGRLNWAWVAKFDPLPSISRFKAPVLLIFGDEDDNQPTEEAVKRWKQGMALAGNDNYRIKVFEGANHGIRLGGDAHHGAGRPPLADGYPEIIGAWLADILE